MRYSRDFRARQPSGRRTLTQQALAIIAKYGASANLYIPGVGEVSGITAGNWLDSLGTTLAAVDNPVGLVTSAAKIIGNELLQGGSWASISGAVLANQATDGVTVSSVAGDVFSAAYKSVSGLIVGRTYSVRASVNITTPGAAVFRVNEDISIGAGAELDVPCESNRVTTVSHVFVATSTTEQVGVILAAQLMNVVLSGVSIREIPGSHLTQATTASKPILRRGSVNWLTKSDFQDGLSDAPTRSGLIAASSLTGYGGALAFGHDGSTTTYALKSYVPTAGTTNTVCAVVQMTDMAAPAWGGDSLTGGNTPFAIVGNGQVAATGGSEYTVAALPNNTYLVAWTFTASGTVGNNGLYKYPANNARTFKATRYGLLQGSFTAQQIIDAGGIPLTTTAPASSNSGRFAWQFDGAGDRFDASMGTINEGWVCAGAKLNSNTTGSHIYGNGASGNSDVGVWIRVPNTSNMLTLLVGDGTNREILSAIVGSSFAGIPRVFDAGWNASLMTCALNGNEVSQAKTINCTTSKLTQFGGAGAFGWFSSGDFYPAIIMSALPTAAERATLRRFVGRLSGVAL